MKKHIALFAILFMLAALAGCSQTFNRKNPVDPVVPPAVPVLTSPPDSSIGIDINPLFIWNAADGATSYTLQVAINSACTSFVLNQSGITTTSRQLSGLLYHTNYYWRVKADKGGSSSEWSNLWSFNTNNANAPAVVTGAATNVTQTMAQLNGSVNPKGDATTWYFQYGLNASYGSNTTMQNAGSDSSVVAESVSISGLSSGTTYHYRIASTNSGGTSYGNDATFNTNLAAPTLDAPTTGSTDIGLTPTLLNWNSVAGATSYTLQVSDNSLFSSYIYNQSVANISLVISNLTCSTTYYWRVNATNAYGTSGWSSVWNFTTIIPLPVEWISIPAGDFTMGSDTSDHYAGDYEQPRHTVTLDAYQISKYLITNSNYKAFMDAGGYSNQSYWTADGWTWRSNNNIIEPLHWTGGLFNSGPVFPNHPVVGVSWYEAYAFCQWAGGYLPTEAQWERASRGTDHRFWPWGNTWDAGKCNNKYNTAPDTFIYSSPVNYFASGISPCGAYDMVGNVWQWCNDWFGYYYYSVSPDNNPTGPATGTTRVKRGGASYNDVSGCRSATRSHSDPAYRDKTIGFRMAQ